MLNGSLAVSYAARHSLAMLTGQQIRAARAMLKWTAKDLAERSGLSWDTIQRMDSSDGPLPGRAVNVDKVKRAFEDAGVIFLEDGETKSGGPGVRLKP